jgi:outer membrane protein assembly factor BamD
MQIPYFRSLKMQRAIFSKFSSDFLLGILLFVSMTFIHTGCSPQSKIIKSGTPEQKFEIAKQYYIKQNYARALPIFQELLGQFRESEKSEEVYYYIAYCYYGLNDFHSAGSHFRNFTESFFNSRRLEECYFMYCLCQYKASDPYYLDQHLTKRAIENFQLFLNIFPDTKYRQESNKYMDELRNKLMKKAYENAYQYYHIMDYKAALVAFGNCLKDYPDLPQKEKTEYLIVKSSYLLAINSVESKQKERLEEVHNYYKEYITNNGIESQYYPEVIEIKLATDKQLEKYQILNQ